MTRFLIYSHDTYGLGHLRRCTLLAGAIVSRAADHEVLIATGSPLAQSFALPERVDTVKLPTATKDGKGAYQPRRIGGTIDRLVALRSSILRAVVESYRPDVVLVDHAPLGMAGELLPVLHDLAMRPRRPRLVLGLRDIIDEAGVVDRAWQAEGTWEALDAYDQVLVYGDERIETTAQELRLGERINAPVTHTGYVAPQSPDPISGAPFLLVSPGGGGDGQALLRRHLDAVEAGALGGLRSIVVTGPLLSSGRRAELLVRARQLPTVEIVEFTDRMRTLVASASGVISMAGYNTVVEELAAGVPALLVPRCHPRLEQDIRARRLARCTRLERCSVDRLTPERIACFAARLSTGRRVPARPAPELGGAAMVAALLDASRPSARPRSILPDRQARSNV